MPDYNTFLLDSLGQMIIVHHSTNHKKFHPCSRIRIGGTESWKSQNPPKTLTLTFDLVITPYHLCFKLYLFCFMSFKSLHVPILVGRFSWLVFRPVFYLMPDYNTFLFDSWQLRHWLIQINKSTIKWSSPVYKGTLTAENLRSDWIWFSMEIKLNLSSLKSLW